MMKMPSMKQSSEKYNQGDLYALNNIRIPLNKQHSKCLNLSAFLSPCYLFLCFFKLIVFGFFCTHLPNPTSPVDLSCVFMVVLISPLCRLIYLYSQRGFVISLPGIISHSSSLCILFCTLLISAWTFQLFLPSPEDLLFPPASPLNFFTVLTLNTCQSFSHTDLCHLRFANSSEEWEN